jgi:hypothetical protein
LFAVSSVYVFVYTENIQRKTLKQVQGDTLLMNVIYCESYGYPALLII